MACTSRRCCNASMPGRAASEASSEVSTVRATRSTVSSLRWTRFFAATREEWVRARQEWTRAGHSRRLDRAARAGSTVVADHQQHLAGNLRARACYRGRQSARDGGDIVVMNPHTGEILALASNRVGHTSFSNTALTEPFEPGSTPQTVCRCVAHWSVVGPGRVTWSTRTTEGSTWMAGLLPTCTRPPSSHSSMSFGFPANIGIVEFGRRLTPRQKYEMFRDLDSECPWCSATAEAPGTLREPKRVVQANEPLRF